jgi:AMIN domain-containing protein
MPLPKIAWISILAATSLSPLLSTPAHAQGAEIQHVAVLKSGAATQIQIETSKRLLPLTQVLTDPDRLVIDFPDARPGPSLHALSVNRADVKSVRTSLFSANPLMTRVVVELNSAQDFELVPSSNSIVIKFAGTASSAAAATPAQPAVAAAPVEATPQVARETTPEPPEPKALEPKAAEAKIAEPKLAQPKLAQPKMPELKTRDSVAATSIPDAQPLRPAVTRASVVVQAPTAPATLVPGATSQVRRVAVLKSGGATEIEIEASERIVPEVQVVTGPDRLVIDFPKATPGPQLRGVAVNQGEVKGVRVGLLSAKPPVTRVVLDLKSPQAYQLFPVGKSVIVKLGGAVGIAAAPNPGSVPNAAQAPAPERAKTFEVSFQDGMLSVLSTKGSLADVLTEIRKQTGADITIPAGAEQEEVAASLGPGTPRDVVSQLLNGSRYNFILIGADNDPNKLERVILSPKGAGEIMVQDMSPRPETVPVAQMQGPDRSVQPAPPAAAPPPAEEQPQGDSMPPETTPQPGEPQPAPN